MTQQRGEDEQEPMKRQLLYSLVSAPAELADELLITRCKAIVLNSSGELKASFSLKAAIASPAASSFDEVRSRALQESTKLPTTQNLAYEQVSAQSYCGSVTCTQSLSDETQPKTLLYGEHQQELPSLTEATSSTLQPEPTGPRTRRELAQELVRALSGWGFIKHVQIPARTSASKMSYHTELQQVLPSLTEATSGTSQPDPTESPTKRELAQELIRALSSRGLVKGVQAPALTFTHKTSDHTELQQAVSSLTKATSSTLQSEPTGPRTRRELAQELVRAPSGWGFIKDMQTPAATSTPKMSYTELQQALPSLTEAISSTLPLHPTESPTRIELAQELVRAPSSRVLVKGVQAPVPTSIAKTSDHTEVQQALPSLTEATRSTLQPEPPESPTRRELAQELVRAPSGHGFKGVQTPAPTSTPKVSGHTELLQASPATPSFMELTQSTLQPECIEPHTAAHPGQQQAREPPNRRFVMGKLSRRKALSRTLNGTASRHAWPAQLSLTTATPRVSEAKPLERTSIRELAPQPVPKPALRPLVDISEPCHKGIIRKLYWRQVLKVSAAVCLFMKENLITVPPRVMQEEVVEIPGCKYGTHQQLNHPKGKPVTLLHASCPPMSPAAPLFTTAEPSTLHYKYAWPPNAREVIIKQIRIPPNSEFEMSTRLHEVKLPELSLTIVTRFALQQAPAQLAAAQEEVVAPGWGFVTSLESHVLKNKRKDLHQSEQQEFHRRLTSHDNARKRQHLTGNALMLHNERLSSSNLHQRQPQLIPSQTLEWVPEPLKDWTKVSIPKNPSGFGRKFLTTSLGGTSAAYQTADKSQQTKSLRASSSFHVTENDSRNCAIQPPNENPVYDDKQRLRKLGSHKEQNSRFVIDDELYFIGTSSEAMKLSLQKTNTEKLVRILNPRETNAHRHAADYVLPLSEKQMCKTKPPANIRMLRLEKIFDHIKSKRRSASLMPSKRSPVTQVRGCPMSTEMTERLLEDAVVLVDNNELCWDEAQSGVSAVNKISELTNEKQLSPTSSRWKDEMGASIKQIFSKDTMQSNETDSSSINAVLTMSDSSFQDSNSRNDIAPSVAETVWVNKVAPLKRERNQEPPADQTPSEVKEESKNEGKSSKQTPAAHLKTRPQVEVTSSLETMKSINEVEAPKNEAVPKKPARKTGSTSNKALTGGQKEVEITSKPEPSSRKCSSKNKVTPSKQDCGRNRQSLADETKCVRNRVSEKGKCPRKKPLPVEPSSARKKMAPFIQQIEPLNEEEAIEKEPTHKEKSLRRDIRASVTDAACEGSRNIYKPSPKPHNFVTDCSTQAAMASPRKSSQERMPLENRATPSKPKRGRKAVSLPEKTLSVGEKSRERKETAPKTANFSTNPLAPGSKDVENTLSTQPLPSQDCTRDLLINAEATGPISHSPTTKTTTKRSLPGGKSSLPMAHKKLPSKLSKYNATAERRPQSRALFSAIYDKGDSFEISQPTSIHAFQIDSTHDEQECTLFETLNSPNQIEQRQRETGVLAKPSCLGDGNDGIHNKGDSRNSTKEQARSAMEMTPSAQRLRPSDRSWTDVVVGVRKTGAEISPADTDVHAPSLPIGDLKERDSSKGSPCAQLKQNGLAQDNLALATESPRKATKQGDSDDAKNYEPFKSVSQEWIESLKKVKEPQHCEEKHLSRLRLEGSTTSQEKQLKPEIIALSFGSPSLELPHHKKTYSEVCKDATERKRGVEKIDPSGNSPIQTAGIEAVIRNSSAPTKSPGNEHDTSDATSHYEGLWYFQDDMAEDSCDEVEASKWEWNTGRKTSTPTKVSAYSVLRDVQQWQPSPPCNRSHRPHLDVSLLDVLPVSRHVSITPVLMACSRTNLPSKKH